MLVNEEGGAPWPPVVIQSCSILQTLYFQAFHGVWDPHLFCTSVLPMFSCTLNPQLMPWLGIISSLKSIYFWIVPCEFRSTSPHVFWTFFKMSCVSSTVTCEAGNQLNTEFITKSHAVASGMQSLLFSSNNYSAYKAVCKCIILDPGSSTTCLTNDHFNKKKKTHHFKWLTMKH